MPQPLTPRWLTSLSTQITGACSLARRTNGAGPFAHRPPGWCPCRCLALGISEGLASAGVHSDTPSPLGVVHQAGMRHPAVPLISTGPPSGAPP